MRSIYLFLLTLIFPLNLSSQNTGKNLATKELYTFKIILDRLSNDDDYSVRQRVASNLNTSVEILDKLSDEDNSVRMAVAENENVSIELLEKLSKDKSNFVRMIVAEHTFSKEDGKNY